MTSKAFELAQLGDAVTVDSSKVGINTTSPSSALDISAPTDTTPLTIKAATDSYNYSTIKNAAGNDVGYFGLGSALVSGADADDFVLRAQRDNLIFTSGGASERARLDASGNFMCGTTVNQFNLTSGGDAGMVYRANASLDVARDDGTVMFINRLTSEGDFVEYRKNGAEIGTISNNGNNFIFKSKHSSGRVQLQTHDGNEDIELDPSGFIKFETAGSERVRIDAYGDLLVGHDSFSYSGSHDCVQIMQSEGRINIENNTTSGQYVLAFYNTNGQVGKIITSGSSTSYNTSSDYRLKENVADIADGITRVKQLAPKRFNFIADADTTVDGFLAHEAQGVVPEAVTGEKDEVDADGNEVLQGIDQSKLVPLLTAALQEAIAKIETLETENVAIKARLDALEAD